MFNVATPVGPVLLNSMQEAQAFVKGFNHALCTYGIYKDGLQRIGCLEKPVKEAQLDASAITAEEKYEHPPSA